MSINPIGILYAYDEPLQLSLVIFDQIKITKQKSTFHRINRSPNPKKNNVQCLFKKDNLELIENLLLLHYLCPVAAF